MQLCFCCFNPFAFHQEEIPPLALSMPVSWASAVSLRVTLAKGRQALCAAVPRILLRATCHPDKDPRTRGSTSTGGMGLVGKGVEGGKQCNILLSSAESVGILSWSRSSINTSLWNALCVLGGEGLLAGLTAPKIKWEQVSCCLFCCYAVLLNQYFAQGLHLCAMCCQQLEDPGHLVNISFWNTELLCLVYLIFSPTLQDIYYLNWPSSLISVKS